MSKFKVTILKEYTIEADDKENAMEQAEAQLKNEFATEMNGLYDVFDIEVIKVIEPVFSDHYPVTFDDKGLRDFIQDNFAEEKGDWISDIHLTDEMIEQFKRHLEADISDWLKDNWRDFTENRGD